MHDSDVSRMGLQLYQMVSATDCLITDYSSIGNDYILLNRPIIYTLDDYEEYKKSRGFSIDDPAKFFPGHHVIDMKELLYAIEDVTRGEDRYAEDRRRILPIMHKYLDGNSSRRIAEHIGL